MLVRANLQRPVRLVSTKCLHRRSVGLVHGSARRYPRRPCRNICASDNPHNARKSLSEMPSTAMIGALQWTCIFCVLGIQAGVLVERLQKQAARQQHVQLSSSTANHPTSTSFCSELAQHQPLLLAVGVACAMLTKSSSDRYTSTLPAQAQLLGAVPCTLQFMFVIFPLYTCDILQIPASAGAFVWLCMFVWWYQRH